MHCSVRLHCPSGSLETNCIRKIRGYILRELHGCVSGFNSLRLSYIYMHQENIPTLLQIMACRLFGAKPLSEPMLLYCQLDPISVKFFLKVKKFSFTEIHLKMCVICKMTAILSQPQCVKTQTSLGLHVSLQLLDHQHASWWIHFPLYASKIPFSFYIPNKQWYILHFSKYALKSFWDMSLNTEVLMRIARYSWADDINEIIHKSIAIYYTGCTNLASSRQADTVADILWIIWIQYQWYEMYLGSFLQRIYELIVWLNLIKNPCCLYIPNDD